jgi:hypothetical protein
MSFGTMDDGDSDDVMNEINMTPLVDVMLVLLIIFIITVPVMKHSVNVDLPRATNQPEDTKPATVQLGITADGKYSWNGQESATSNWRPIFRPKPPRSRSPTCISAATRKCATNAWPRPWPPPSALASRKSAL